jgi:hypothetical protein
LVRYCRGTRCPTERVGAQQAPSIDWEIRPHPEVTVELGRHRRRQIVRVSAARYDEMLERERLVEDLAWAAFAQERLEHPTSPPVGWDEAQRRRSRR